MQERMNPVEFARLQRPRSDEFDRMMWRHLRSRQSCQQKFRVEHSLRIYVANFYCSAAKLNVEVDGPVHPSTGVRQNDSVRKRIDACLTAICRISCAFSNRSTLQYFLLELLNDRNLIQPWRGVGFVFIKGAGGTRKPLGDLTIQLRSIFCLFDIVIFVPRQKQIVICDDTNCPYAETGKFGRQCLRRKNPSVLGAGYKVILDRFVAG